MKDHEKYIDRPRPPIRLIHQCIHGTRLLQSIREDGAPHNQILPSRYHHSPFTTPLSNPSSKSTCRLCRNEYALARFQNHMRGTKPCMIYPKAADTESERKEQCAIPIRLGKEDHALLQVLTFMRVVSRQCEAEQLSSSSPECQQLTDAMATGLFVYDDLSQSQKHDCRFHHMLS